MKYHKIVSNGYIFCVSKSGMCGEEIAKDEYDRILSIINSCPIAPSGYRYLLKTDLSWELQELPVETDEPIEGETDEATETDYQNELRRLGVEV